MCFPPAIIAGLAAAAVGTGAKYIGDKQAESASNATFSAERARQQAFTADQTAKFQDSLDRTKELTDPAQQEKAVAAREETLASAIVPASTAGSYLPGSSSAPSVVSTAQDKSAATSAATSSSLARAIATLGGVQDQKQGVDTAIGHNSSAIGQISGFRSGSAGVLNSEMKAAAQKGSFLRGVGGLAQQFGMMALSHGLGAPSVGTGTDLSYAANGASTLGKVSTAVSPFNPGVF